MSENEERTAIMNNITENIHDFTSSSDSDDEMPSTVFITQKSLFGRTEPVHVVLGGGKAADIVLWRNKKLSGAIFVGVTMTWYLFERIGYPLITFLCQILMLLLAISFVWSKAASLTKLSPPNFPDVLLSEDVFSQVAQCVRHEINEAFITFCYVAFGKDVLVFVKVIAGLWLLSVAGSWFSLLTFSYIVFVLAFTVPVIYETYQDPIDSNWDKFMDWNRISVVIKLLKIIRGHLKGE